MSAQGYNRALLLGNVGRSELRGSVLQFSVATNERYQDRERQWKERTEWHNVVVFGARAEPLSRMLQKGDRVFVEGSLRTNKFETRDGQKREKTEIIASEVIISPKGSAAPSASGASENSTGPSEYEGDYGGDPF